ncbi:MAG: hypothetical protein KF781_05490 [Chitinophagaceae bacterium]|nr:hypothetical protein [Chitinophagaceae bacterium]MCW5905971.1 hypothetical protein [Chitinophagaceae bacterium]
MNMINEPITPFVFADLYKNSLTIIENNIESKDEQNNLLIYLGENKKHIIILVEEENALHLEEDSYTFLLSILTACKLNMADIAIVNSTKQTVTYSTIKQQLLPTICIAFGNVCKNIQLPFQINLFEPYSFDNTVWLQSSALNLMKPNTQEAKIEKSKLWICLKQMLHI